jgi:hypothetical protein
MYILTSMFIHYNLVSLFYTSKAYLVLYAAGGQEGNRFTYCGKILY